MEMPFGKHKGEPLHAIPTDYLEWLNTIELQPWLRAAVDDEYQARCGQRRQQRSSNTGRRPGSVDVAGWYRRLSLYFHPDRGGTKEAMQAVNKARELLEEMLQ